MPGIPDAGVEAHHDRDAAARRLRPDGALRGALSTPRELQMFPRARRGSISHRNLRESHAPKLRSGRGGAFAAARVAATAPPALHLHVDVLNQVFTCEDDLFGSVALAPYLEGGAESGQLVDVPLMRAEGQLGGVLSCSWRLVRSSELIDLWEPSLMDTTAS